jgi:lipopolysaccharide/colanic/teichoic acid biosynthesis glycosyltransferase
MTIKNILNYNNYYLGYQSLFFDFKILIETQFSDNVSSISKIYNGAL